MGRGKLQMKLIEDTNKRQVSFSKRRGGFFKKGMELGVLCNSQVAAIIFSESGKLFEYSSVRMEEILERYKQFPKASINSGDKNKSELALKNVQENLPFMTGQELEDVELQLNSVLHSVKERKAQLMIQPIQGQGALEGNQTGGALEVFQAPVLPLTYSEHQQSNLPQTWYPASASTSTAAPVEYGRPKADRMEKLPIYRHNP